MITSHLNTYYFIPTTVTIINQGLNSFKCMIRGASLTSPYTQLGILSLPPIAPIFLFNLEVIMANCLFTARVTLLGYYQLTETVQLGLQIIQKLVTLFPYL